MKRLQCARTHRYINDLLIHILLGPSQNTPHVNQSLSLSFSRSLSLSVSLSLTHSKTHTHTPSHPPASHPTPFLPEPVSLQCPS